MSRATPQSAIDAAFKEVRRTRKPLSVSVLSHYGQGALTLQLRHAVQGATARWVIRAAGTDGQRQAISLGRYDAGNLGGAMSRDTAIAEYNEWTRRSAAAGERLVKPEGAYGPYMTQSEARPVAPSETAQALFDCYMGYSRKHNTAKTVSIRESMWRSHCEPLAAMRVRDVTARQVRDLVLAPLVNAGHPVHANGVRRFLNAMFNAAFQVSEGSAVNMRLPNELAVFGLKSNPLAALRSIPGGSTARNRPMQFESIVATYAALGEGMREDAARLSLLLAGTRFTQIAALTRRDFDLAQRTVRLSDSKGRALTSPRVYELPLGEEGMKVARRIVLALGEDGAMPTPWSIAYRGLRPGMVAAGVLNAGDDRQPKDVRSTFTTWLAEQNVHQSVSDWIQSHGLGTLVNKHYMGLLDGKVRTTMELIDATLSGRQPLRNSEKVQHRQGA